MTAVSYFSASNCKVRSKNAIANLSQQKKRLPFALSSYICRERKREKTLEGDDLWNNFLSESGSFQRNNKQKRQTNVNIDVFALCPSVFQTQFLIWPVSDSLF
jgi:hypothetical protein